MQRSMMKRDNEIAPTKGYNFFLYIEYILFSKCFISLIWQIAPRSPGRSPQLGGSWGEALTFASPLSYLIVINIFNKLKASS